MADKNSTIQKYIDGLPKERQDAIQKLRKILKENLPVGFEERPSYGMIGYVVPKKLYPDGYHVDPSLPLPFINLASQKNYIALYHSGIYADESLSRWFVDEYPKYVSTKLDMGKSCIRFKNIHQIPYELIAQLAQKMSVNDWIELYEKNIKTKS